MFIYGKPSIKSEWKKMRLVLGQPPLFSLTN